jgi:hypothetical protein
MTAGKKHINRVWEMAVLAGLLFAVFGVVPVAADNPWSTGLYPFSYYNYTTIPSANDVRFLPYPDTDTRLINLTMFNGTGGMNAVHISDSDERNTAVLYGEATETDSTTDTFYITNTGGRNYQDNIILLIGVASSNDDERQKIAVDINASGYSWTPHTVVNQGPFEGEPVTASTDITITKDDYATDAEGGVYQNWKFAPNPNTPMYCGQNMSLTDSANLFNWTAVDLKMGIISNTTYWDQLNSNGTVKVDYNVRRTDGGDLGGNETRVAFNMYAYNRYTSQGVNQTLWLNRVYAEGGDPTGSSGWLVYLEP